MKRTFVSFLALALVTLFSAFSFADDANLSNLVRLKITGNGVNVRSEASAKGKVLGKADKDDKYLFFIAWHDTMRDSEGMEWYRIAYVGQQQEERVYDVPSEFYEYDGAPEAYISARFARAGKLDDWDKERIAFMMDPKFSYLEDGILTFSLKTPLRYKDSSSSDRPDAVVEPGTEIYINLYSLFSTNFDVDGTRIITIYKKKDEKFGSMLGSALYDEVMAAEKFFASKMALDTEMNGSERPILHINEDERYDSFIRDFKYDENVRGKLATPEFALSVPLELRYFPDTEAPIEATVPANTNVSLFAPPFLYSDGYRNKWRIILSRKNPNQCAFLGFVNEAELEKFTTNEENE
jgi:hypothetical protein